MVRPSVGALVRRLSKAVGPASSLSVSDTELLSRYVRLRDEAAFELLVRRHQRMVQSVCRRVLLDAHESEDAFQATFLALAMKSGSLLGLESVGGWLHTVASRIALRARKRSAKRVTVGLDGAAGEAQSRPTEGAVWKELSSVLDEEVSRLPEQYRIAVVMCYLEGKSYREAGRHLGVPVGTLAARLARARALLHARLTRRGIDLSSAALVSFLAGQAASAASGAHLVRSTVETAALLGRQTLPLTGASATAVKLAEDALRSMVVVKLKLAAVVLSAGLLVTMMGWLALGQTIARQGPQENSSENKPEDKKPSIGADRDGNLLPPGVLFRFGSMSRRHDGLILASALAPDGKLLATISDRSVVLWDLATDKPIQRFPHEGPGTFSSPELQFSPDGRRLGYVQSGGFGCVRDVKSGKELVHFTGRSRPTSPLCSFTPDGKHFIFSGEKGRVTFWHLSGNRISHTLPLEGIALMSPDARYCVRAQAGALIFHDAQTGKESNRLAVAAEHNGERKGIAFAPDSKSLAVVHQNKEVRVLAFPSGKLLVSFPLPDSAKKRHWFGWEADHWEYRLCWSGDSRTLMLGTLGGVVHRWAVATGKELPALCKHSGMVTIGEVTDVHALPNGRSLVSAGLDGLIRRWDAQTGREVSEPPGYVGGERFPSGRVHTAYSPDGRFVAVGDARGRLDLWDARRGQRLRTLRQTGPSVQQLAFTPDGKALAEQSWVGNAIQFWAVPSGKQEQALNFGGGANFFTTPLAFSPDGQRLLIGQNGGLYERRTGKRLWRIGGVFQTSVFSHDGNTMFEGTGHHLVFRNASNGNVFRVVKLKSGFPPSMVLNASMALAPDGRLLALGLYSGDVYLCDAQTGAEIKRFQAVVGSKPGAFEEPVWGVSFSPDGSWLGTAGNDGTARLWEVATGREVLRLAGHAGQAAEVSFGADGRTMLTSGGDAQAYLWSLRPKPVTGKPSAGALWGELAAEPARAYRAIWQMSEVAGAAELLGRNLAPPRNDRERLRKLIDDLDSDEFSQRQSAHQRLRGMGEAALPAMRQAMAGKPSAEQKSRLKELIRHAEKAQAEIEQLSPEELRARRAIVALELLGTDEARRVLKAVAAGLPGPRTRAAQSALKRLQR
jgi:RNA polymerase sigma factor (sigma-70 family)